MLSMFLYEILTYICVAGLDILFLLFFQATGSWDFTVRLWTPSDVDQMDDNVQVLTGHKGNIHAVSFSKDGMLVC